MGRVTIRTAQRNDAEAVIELLGDLNEYEGVSRPDAETRARLWQDGFGPSPRFQVLVAVQDETVVGFALYFEMYCSFLANPVLFLDGMYVKPEVRGKHAGSGLFYELAKKAVEGGCPRMEWTVYGFHDVAVVFYERMHGTPVFEWDANRAKDFRVYRLEGDALLTAAGRATRISSLTKLETLPRAPD